MAEGIALGYLVAVGGACSTLAAEACIATCVILNLHVLFVVGLRNDRREPGFPSCLS